MPSATLASILVRWRLCLALASGAAAADAPQAPVSPPYVVRTGAVAGHADWRFWELTPDLTRVTLRIVDKPGGAPLAAMLDDQVLAAINGGYWTADYQPTGWVQDQRRTLRKRSAKARGGVVAVAGDRVHVGSLAALEFEPEFAIQNSPLLLEATGQIGIHKDDGRHASRTVACRTANGALRFILLLAAPGNGPTLFETAHIVSKPRGRGGFDCVAALNLDGGPSSGIWLRSGGDAPPLVPIGYGIAIAARPKT